MNKKGFTLVEMMAVIAVLGLLVLLVLPNVLKSYKDAKKISFINEAKTIYKASTDKFVTERTKGNKIGLIEQEKDSSTNPLSLAEASDLNYTIRLDNDGKVTAFKMSNAEFCIVGVGDFLGGYSKEDVIELSDEERASECVTTALQNNQKLILRLQNKENINSDYNPKIIFLKYKNGWYSDNNLHKPLDKTTNGTPYVTKPSKENHYYNGAFVKKGDIDIKAINCDGTVAVDNTGGGIFTGKEEKPYVEAFSNFIKKYYLIVFTGGEGSINPLKCEYGASKCELPDNLSSNGYGLNIKKTGYLFKGWKNSVTNTVYANKAELPVLTDSTENNYSNFKFNNEEVCSSGENPSTANSISFEAQWEPINYHVAYDCNTGNGTMANTDHIYDKEKNLRAKTCTKTGYTFLGWSKTKNGNKQYDDSQEVKNLTTENNATVTLYAVWKVNTYTVTYNTDEGSECQNKTVTYDSNYGELCTSTKENNLFLGWYLDAAFNNKVESTTKVTTASNHTLYAKWEPQGFKFKYSGSFRVAGDSKVYPAHSIYENEWYTTSDKNWKIYFLSDGNFIPKTTVFIQAFLVGGGGGRASHYDGDTWLTFKSNGGGGYHLNTHYLTIGLDSYPIVIGGPGGDGSWNGSGAGKNTVAFEKTAKGGGGVGSWNAYWKSFGTASGGTECGEFETSGKTYSGKSSKSVANSGKTKSTGIVIIRPADFNFFGYYTGKFQIGNNTYENDFINITSSTWKIKFLTSGTLSLRDNTMVDAFLVGGGGAGATGTSGSAGGGGGGYTKTVKNISLSKLSAYKIVIGSGGKAFSTFVSCDGTCTDTNGLSRGGQDGGASSAFGYTANGGKGGYSGNGGSSSNSQYGGSSGSKKGQGYTTCEFEESKSGDRTDLSGCANGVTAYSGGGIDSVGGPMAGGGCSCSGGACSKGKENTGGAGCGYYSMCTHVGGWHNDPGWHCTNPSSGGSGIVIIRNPKLN